MFFTDGRYTEQSRHEVADLERVTYLDEFARAARRGVRRGSASGSSGSRHTTSPSAACGSCRTRSPDVEFVAVGEAVERLRWIKDAEEIALLNEAQSCTDVAFDDILERLAVGMTERQVALELEHALRRAGRGRAVVRVDRGVRGAGCRAASPARRTGCSKRAT